MKKKFRKNPNLIKKRFGSKDNSGIVPEGERLCPICNEKMLINLKDDVTLDVCKEHGVWLDKGELRRLFSRKNRQHLARQESLIRRLEAATCERW